MSDYTVTTNFGAKDDLASGNAAKLIKGSEFTTEFDNIATAVATKADISNPTFTGTVTIPTANISAGAIVATSLDLEDDNKIKLGTGDDLEIYHDATGGNSVIADVGTGALQLRGSAVRVLNADGTETLARFTADSSTELYYDNSKKLETTASGVTVTGVIASDGLDTGDNDKLLLGNGDDLELYHGGTNSVIQNNTGHLKLLSDSILIKNNADNEFMIKGTADGAVELYYNNGKKVETLDNGAKVTGSLIAGSKIGIGTDTPSKPLHVYSATTDVVGRFESGDAEAGVEFVDNTSTAVLKNNAGTLNIISDNGNEVADSVINLKVDGNNTIAQVTPTGVEVTGDLDTDSITLGTVKILTGSGAPSVAAPVGSLYLRTDGGADTTLYVKESGTDASGWVAK